MRLWLLVGLLLIALPLFIGTVAPFLHRFPSAACRFTCDPNYQRMIDRAGRLFRGGAASRA